MEPHGSKPVNPPHVSKGLPSPKRLPSARLLEAGLRAGRRNPPKHIPLRFFEASKVPFRIHRSTPQVMADGVNRLINHHFLRRGAKRCVSGKGMLFGSKVVEESAFHSLCHEFSELLDRTILAGFIDDTAKRSSIPPDFRQIIIFPQDLAGRLC